MKLNKYKSSEKNLITDKKILTKNSSYNIIKNNENQIKFGDYFIKSTKIFDLDDDDFELNKDLNITINGIKDLNNENINSNKKLKSFKNLDSTFNDFNKVSLISNKKNKKFYLFNNNNGDISDFVFIKKNSKTIINFNKYFQVFLKKEFKLFNLFKCLNKKKLKYNIFYNNKYIKNKFIGNIEYNLNNKMQKYYIKNHLNKTLFIIYKIFDFENKNFYYELNDFKIKKKIYLKNRIEYTFNNNYNWISKILLILFLNFLKLNN